MSHSSKPHLLLVGNAYWVAVNRRKAAAFSRHYRVTCVGPLAAGRGSFGRELVSEEKDPDEVSYVTRLLPGKGDRQKGTRWFLEGFQEVMKETRPDVVLVETEPWTFLFWQVWWAKWKFARDAAFGLFSWENLRRPGLKGFALDRVYSRASRVLDFLIAGNEGCKALFRRAGLPERRIQIDAQLGFVASLHPEELADQKKRWRASEGVSDEALIVGFCGRFVEEKGVLDLRDAIVKFSEEFPELVIELHFLGAGPLEEELGKDCGLTVRLHKPVAHDEVLGVLAGWDYFVLPSKRLEKKGELWEEQFGHVLLQAMGAGLVTLGSRSGAIPEVLGQNEEVLFEAGNPQSICGCLESFVRNPELAQKTVQGQMSRARDHYSFELIAKRYAQHIDKVTGLN